MARFIDELKRTHHCGALRASDAGKEVVLFGWVASYRDHGGCVFVDLRDREGITQVVFDPDARAATATPARPPTSARRPCAPSGSSASAASSSSRGANKNPKLPTGEIEVHVVELTRLQQGRHAALRDRGRHRHRARRSASSTATSTSAARRSRARCSVRHRINQITRRYFDDAGLPRARDARSW